MTLAELEKAKAASLEEIAAAADASAAEALRVKYIGRNGSIPALIKAMKDVPKEERPAFGKAVQAWRAEVESALAAKLSRSSQEAFDGDLTQPGRWFGLVRARPAPSPHPRRRGDGAHIRQARLHSRRRP